MATQQCKSGPRLTQSKTCQVRSLKVRQGYYTRTVTPEHTRFVRTLHIPVPWINIQGQWLERAGFSVHTPIKVRVMDGCLVLTAET